MSDEISEPASTAEVNKAASRRWIQAFNDGDLQAEADSLSEDFVAHAPASLAPDPLDSQAWAEFLAGFREGFPDLHLTIEDSVADAELSAQRIRFEGTHTGVFQGLPPTSRKVSFYALEINRLVDGKVAEHWFQMDQVTFLRQLGLMPVPGPRLLPRILAHQLTRPFRKRG